MKKKENNSVNAKICKERENNRVDVKFMKKEK